MKTLCVTIFFLSVNLLYAFEPTEKYDREVLLRNLPTIEQYRLYWKVVGDEIIFESHVGTLGWVGLGFSPTGGMAGSDIVIGGVRKNETYLYDCFATGDDMPSCSEHQDYSILYGAQNETHTVLKFKRNLTICDKNDWKINNDTVRLIWAFHLEDAESATKFQMHKERGHRSILLLEPSKTTRLTMPPDVVIYDLNVTNVGGLIVSIPSNTDTLYLCKIFKMPNKPKHHIVKYEVVIQPGNEKYLHHVVVFHCLYDMEKFVDKQEPCFSDDHTRASEMYKCTSRYIVGWGLGAEATVFPDDLGFPIFEEGRSPYLMIEFHYTNTKKVAGLYDNSGMRFYLTQRLRPKEMASIILGLGFDNNTILLPPGQKSIKMQYACDFKCTQDLPESGINIMNGFLHQHQQGQSVTLRHVRNGVELPPIFRDSHYDFKYQEQRYLQNARKFLPNDTLIVECEWQTMDRNNMTFGGYSSADEMCLLFATYYPKTDNLLSCLGGPVQQSFADGFGAKVVSPQTATSPIVVQGFDGANVSLASYSLQMKWNDDVTVVDPSKLQTTKMQKLQQKIDTGLYYQYCAKRLDPNSTVTPAMGDVMGRAAGQTVFNPNGVQMIEKLEEHYYPPQPLDPIKVPYVVQDPCQPSDAGPKISPDSPLKLLLNGSSIETNETVITTIASATTTSTKKVEATTKMASMNTPLKLLLPFVALVVALF